MVLVKIPVAPLPATVAVKVTLTPLTGLPSLSVTFTASEGNAVLGYEVCVRLAVVVMLAAVPDVFVRLKLAVVDDPEAAAVTI
jgi:hypothetical protein